jgi:hypothetical protein
MDWQTQRRAREWMQQRLWKTLGSKRRVGGWRYNSGSWVLPDGEAAVDFEELDTGA